MLHHHDPLQPLPLPRLLNNLLPILQHTLPSLQPIHPLQQILDQLPQPPANIHHDSPFLLRYPPKIIQRPLPLNNRIPPHNLPTPHAPRKHPPIVGIQRLDLPRRQRGVAPAKGKGRVALSRGLAPAVQAEVFGPVGEGLHAVADGHGAERGDGGGGAVERGDARVGEGVGEGAWVEFGGGEEVVGDSGWEERVSIKEGSECGFWMEGGLGGVLGGEGLADEGFLRVEGEGEVGDGDVAVERDVVEGFPVDEDVPRCDLGDLGRSVLCLCPLGGGRHAPQSSRISPRRFWVPSRRQSSLPSWRCCGGAPAHCRRRRAWWRRPAVSPARAGLRRPRPGRNASLMPSLPL